MYYQSSARPNDPQEPESDRLKTLLDNLNNLRGKLKNFTVIDELGQPIGEISDLILDAGHQLNLVIAQPDTQEHQSSVLLNGRRIKKVSVQTQSVFVDITKADVRFLPEYLLPDGAAPVQPPFEALVENHGLAQPPVEEFPERPTPPPVTPDFSLDVMEPPLDSTPTTSNDALDFLDLQDSTTSGPSDDFLELETPVDNLTTDRLDSGDDLFELELNNEARSLDEFGLLDSSTNSSAESLDLDLAIDETVEANASAEVMPALGFEADPSPDSSAEWEEFDRIMAIEPESATTSDLNGTLDEFTDTNPLPEGFALVEDPTPANTSSDTSLPESFALDDLSDSTGIELPELSLGESNLDFPTENYLPELGTEESESLPPLDLPSEATLPELNLSEPEGLESLDFSTEDNLSDFRAGESENLSSLDFSIESEDLPDLNAQSESLTSLDFPVEDNLPDLTLGESEDLAALDFSTEETFTDLGTSEEEGLPDLDFTVESDADPELNIGESENLASFDLNPEDNLPELSLGELETSTSLDFALEDSQPDASTEDSENLTSLDFAADDNLLDLPELSLDQAESSSALEFESENALPELEFNSGDDFPSLELNSSIDNSEDETESLLIEPTPSNEVEAQWAEFDREMNIPSVDLASLESLEPSSEGFSEANNNFGAESDAALPDLNFDLADPSESSQDLLATDTFASLDFDNESDTPQTDLGLPDLDFTAESSTSESVDTALSNLDFAAESTAPESFGDFSENSTLETEEPSTFPGDLTFQTELTDSGLVGDSDEIVFTEDGETEEESDLSTISSLADLDFTPEVTEPEALNLAEFETSSVPDFSLADTTESTNLDELEALPEFNLVDESELLNGVGADASIDLDFGASPELIPNLSLGEFSPPSENLNLDESLDSRAESQDLNLDESLDFAIESPDLSLDETIGFAADESAETSNPGINLPEPPALNLDDLELNSISDLPNPELSFGTEEPTADVDALGITAEDVTLPEFGLASIPAETYDLSSNSESQEILGTDELQNMETMLTSDSVDDAIVPLLEERLKVEYERRKVGEVVVRKRIETRMVQVPVRYEKLVIEQLGDNPKTLAEVDLSQGALDNLEVLNVTGSTQISGEFKSARTAGYVLDAIAKTLRDRCKNVRIEVELDDPKLQKAYQDWLNQCSQIE